MRSNATAALDLLAQARRGDPEAFCELCRLYETRLLRQAMTLCSNPTNAEELAQETLVEAWKGLHRYNGRCQFFTWLCAILLNRYRNSNRRKRPLALSSLVDADRDAVERKLESLSDPKGSPSEAAEQRDEAGVILKWIAMLPPKHQQVIYLRFYVDNSLEGIAAALGCSIGTVKSRLFSALEKLRAITAQKSEGSPTEKRIKEFML